LGVLQIWLLYRDYFIKEYNFADPIRITLLSFFFFIAGMLAARNKDKIIEFVRKWKYLLVAGAMSLGVYVFREGEIYSPWRPSILFYTLAVFSILFYAFDKSRLQFKIVERLSKLSYLVFFIHVIILEEIWKYFGHSLFNLFEGNALGKIAFDPIFFVLVAVTSFGIAYLVHKIPNLAKITG
jgi:peptidoglycan/LPS O-acetylase OafA/YrhL